MKLSLSHICDDSGESYFAIIRGNRIVRALRDCASWNEARLAYRAYCKVQS
jgi:hypothetical protein